MPFHYLYNWLLPLARFRKSRPDKNRYRKKERRRRKRKSTLPKHTSIADRPAAYLGGDELIAGSFKPGDLNHDNLSKTEVKV